MHSEVDLYNEIGKKIKAKRKKLGLTQEQLADLTYFSDSFIRNIESNIFQTFSLSSLNTIANALNTPLQDLLPDRQIIPEETNKLICNHCKYTMEIPVELYKLLKNIEELSAKNITLTCLNCQKKQMKRIVDN